jgi:hypothetical protein
MRKFYGGNALSAVIMCELFDSGVCHASSSMFLPHGISRMVGMGVDSWGTRPRN